MKRTEHTRCLSMILLLAFLLSARSGKALEYPDIHKPGSARVRMQGKEGTIYNDILRVVFQFDNARLKPILIKDMISGQTIDGRACEFFRIHLDHAKPISCSEFEMEKSLQVVNLKADPQAVNLARRNQGKQITATLISPQKDLHVEWSLILRDGSNYIRQSITLIARNKDTAIQSLTLIDLFRPQARKLGTVLGSPVISDTLFFAYEHPNSSNEVKESFPPHPPSKQILCTLDRNIPLNPDLPLTQSAILGVVPQGQLRRGFLYYLERERAQPYRPFLHYNSWYDIAWAGRKMKESECLGVIQHFSTELVQKRGVQMDSFVFDDGWDDNTTLWQFLKSNFPRGFTPLTRLAKKNASAVGVWLSPWGGYGTAKEQRMEYGKQQGFETSRKGFSLAGPKYYARFQQCCVEMIEKYKVNFFKFDGTDAEFLVETEALFRLIDEIRLQSPNLYVSITTGTWASPFWLLHGDNIWRGGADMGFFGKGTRREQWITYRDMQTYKNIVQGGPLYPLNSLMLCGINNGQRGTGKDLPPFGEDFVHEVRSFFATGTNLQELYMTPARMSAKGWDVLAEGAKWSRAHADLLVDTHWIGGDPEKFQVYGWAAWSARKSILSLRNPNDQPGQIVVDIGVAFELPSYARQKYILKSPWQEEIDQPSFVVEAGKKHIFQLQPFDIRVWEATPIP
jgi:hypothetical protein